MDVLILLWRVTRFIINIFDNDVTMMGICQNEWDRLYLNDYTHTHTLIHANAIGILSFIFLFNFVFTSI